ncbi:M13 family metallopeptidase [Parvularcula marina]|uniref:M13 family peptidase n=1 Tax=Parvularcula marina TaxID=2292771 RepID=A0A371RIM1_9PROT|nr:M13 family metallopeptidase [Parvularcula marina]RFB05292.1 M13 family peptidase [Parvularcula marina]
MSRLLKSLLGGVALISLAACATTTGDAGPKMMAEEEGPMIEPWGYPLDAFDPTTRPGDDFFQYANGGWLAATEIPSDRSGTGFSVIMQERNEARIAEIIADLSTSDVAAGSEGQKIRDFYNDFMDVAAIEAKGLDPIAEDVARIRAAKTHEDIARLMADPSLGLPSPIAIYVTIDSKSPSDYVMGATHSGIGMPDRSYYLRESERLDETRAAYKEHLARMLELLGEDNSAKRAAAVFDLETAIAERHWTRAERRNADLTYNRMTIAELEAMAPGMPWEAALDTLGLPSEGDIVVREKSAFPSLAALYAETPVAVWRDYLLANYISSNAAFLPDYVYQANFEFFGKALNGQEEPRDREKRGIALVNGRLDQAVGKEYIDRYFPEESKVLMTEMFEDIRSALSVRIDNLTWMTDATKVKAQEKLAAMTAKIAYPEKWQDYSELDIVSGDLFGNIKRHRVWSQAESNNRLGTKVDKREWFTAPQTVNAFYSPNRNEAFIPAGYIQSPLFDPKADAAINYGAIGSIVGHEIGHGFDDQGSKYDAQGFLQSWWTEEDRAAFDALGDKFAAQFDEYEPLPGLHVNGRQTLGENIGDLAGVLVAYHAYKEHLNGEESPVLDGFTGEQRVFLGRAQARRFKRTEESLRQRLLSAPHSPMYLRVNGMVRNIDEWYDAFDVQPGDELYLPPEERVKIW